MIWQETLKDNVNSISESCNYNKLLYLKSEAYYWLKNIKRLKHFSLLLAEHFVI